MDINGKHYDLKFTGYTLVVYKEEFKADFFNDLNNADNDNMVYFRMLYALVKTADEQVGTFESFMRGIDDVAGVMSKETVEKVMKVVLKDRQPTKEVKKN